MTTPLIMRTTILSPALAATLNLMRLIFEFTPHEPNLTDQELKVLDDVADRVEIQRLRDMQVLLASEVSESGVVPKNLSTRFVRTWKRKSH